VTGIFVVVVHYKMPHGARLGWLKPDLLDNHSQVHEIVEVCHFTVWYFLPSTMHLADKAFFTVWQFSMSVYPITTKF